MGTQETANVAHPDVRFLVGAVDSRAPNSPAEQGKQDQAGSGLGEAVAVGFLNGQP